MYEEYRRMLANIALSYGSFGYFLTILFTKHAGTTVGPVCILANDGVPVWLPFDKKDFFGYLIRFAKNGFLVTVNPALMNDWRRMEWNPHPKAEASGFVCDSTFYRCRKRKKKSLRMKYGLPTERSLWFVQGLNYSRKDIFDFSELAKVMLIHSSVWGRRLSFGSTDGYERGRKVVRNPPC